MRDFRRLVPLALLSVATTAAAQVGHAPESSPYRDIRRGHTVTLFGGNIGGSGGPFEIGPHDGSVFGGRYDLRTSRTLQLGVGLSRGNLERLIVDPYLPPNRRVSGPVKQSMTFAEFDLQFNLTGGKTWHRLAPFAGLGTGMAFSGNTPADTSGFDFGNKFFFVPHAGMRVFITRRVHLRADARIAFWKLSYPLTFLPPTQSGVATDPTPVITDGRTNEWATSRWLQIGLGYSFSP